MDNHYFNTSEQNTCSANSEQYMDALPPIEIAENVFDTLVTQSPYKPSTLQTTMAVILCGIPPLMWFALFFGTQSFSSSASETIFFILSIDAIEALISALCLGLLGIRADNKATKIATYIGTGVFLSHAVLYFLEASNFIDWPFIDTYWRILKGLLLVYVYALIIRNNNLSEKNRIWINSLIVLGVISTNILWTILYHSSFIESLHIIKYDEYISYSMTIRIMGIVFSTIVLSISYWHFARCEAFSGKYDANAQCNYSPLNKWIAAAIIVPVVMVLCIFLLYKNYELFI